MIGAGSRLMERIKSCKSKRVNFNWVLGTGLNRVWCFPGSDVCRILVYGLYRVSDFPGYPGFKNLVTTRSKRPCVESRWRFKFRTVFWRWPNPKILIQTKSLVKTDDYRLTSSQASFSLDFVSVKKPFADKSPFTLNRNEITRPVHRWLRSESG